MIREATLRDVASIRSLMKSVPGFWQESWRDDVLERGIDAAQGLAFVWEEGAEIFGFVCAHDLGFRGYLSELVVAEQPRRRGIGRHLIETVRKKLAECGCAIVIADVFQDAVHFYRAFGWEPPAATLLRCTLL